MAKPVSSQEGRWRHPHVLGEMIEAMGQVDIKEEEVVVVMMVAVAEDTALIREIGMEKMLYLTLSVGAH